MIKQLFSKTEQYISDALFPYGNPFLTIKFDDKSSQWVARIGTDDSGTTIIATHPGSLSAVLETLLSLVAGEEPTDACPRCGAEQVADGMPFTYCPNCEYCTHAARTVHQDEIVVCDVCGNVVKDVD